jgi:hypothetical protein
MRVNPRNVRYDTVYSYATAQKSHSGAWSVRKTPRELKWYCLTVAASGTTTSVISSTLGDTSTCTSYCWPPGREPVLLPVDLRGDTSNCTSYCWPPGRVPVLLPVDLRGDTSTGTSNCWVLTSGVIRVPVLLTVDLRGDTSTCTSYCWPLGWYEHLYFLLLTSGESTCTFLSVLLTVDLRYGTVTREVCRIRNFLVPVRIYGFVHLVTDPDPGSCPFP